MNLKICSSCNKLKPIWKNYQSNKYCKNCWVKINPKTNLPKVAKLKPPKSKPLKSCNPNRGIIRKLDDLVREYLLLTENKCFTCDYTPAATKELQVGHYKSRQVFALRWDLRNVRLQCADCNMVQHGNLREYTDRLNKFEDGLPEKLSREAKRIVKYSTSDLHKIAYGLHVLIQKIKSIH